MGGGTHRASPGARLTQTPQLSPIRLPSAHSRPNRKVDTMAADERSSDAARRARDRARSRRVEQTFAIQMWVLGFITGGGFATLAWAIARAS